jgi:ABC-2 type transport system permease protein
VSRAVHAEWTKLRTLPGTAWAAVFIVLGSVAVSAATAAATGTGNCGPPPCRTDTTALSLAGVYAGQNAVVVLAVLAVTGEYATRMIATTLAARPDRGMVCAAKAMVVTVIVLGAGGLAVVGSVLAGRLILPGNGFTRAAGHVVLPADGTTLRAAAGTVLYLVLLALLSLGVGLAVRDTATAVTAVLAALYVLPLVAQGIPDEDLREDVQQIAPMTAGLAIQATRNLTTLPIGPWAGLGLLAVYATAALLVGAVLFRIRDA